MKKRLTYYRRLTGVLIILIFLCMRLIPVGKLEYYRVESLVPYFFVKAVLFVLLLGFNHKILQYTLAWNLVLSLMLAALANEASLLLFGIGMHGLEHLDNRLTPLGWQFKYLWLENLIFAFLLIGLTELTYGLVRSGRLLKP